MKSYLIIEDESAAARRLERMVSEMEPNLNLCGSCESIESAVGYLNENSAPDLIFMDIQLADGNSFRIFEKVEIKSPVIFTTAYDEYALKAFKVNSVDYLLKPVNAAELRQALDKWQQQSGKNDDNLREILSGILEKKPYKQRFLVVKGDRLIPVSANQIVAWSAEEKQVFMHTSENQSHVTRDSLDELSRQLNPEQFFRAGRAWLVNRDFIEQADIYFNGKIRISLKGYSEKEILVSRDRAQDFKSWWAG
ncbi:MAG: response regulator transcription factor [Bacteroidetes bacterium]|nr:response regulator transcription factor [Bacteroidota bacterium]